MHARRLLALLVLCAATASGQAIDLVSNGGFETGDFTAWNVNILFNANATIVSPGSSSSFAARLETINLFSSVELQTDDLGAGVVLPGQPVTLELDARGVDVGGFRDLELVSVDAAGNESVLLLGLISLDPNPSVWSTTSVTTTTGSNVAGGIALRVRLGFLAAPLEVDNVRVLVDPPAYPGSGDDLILETGVNGGLDAIDIKTANAGDALLLRLQSPAGAFDFSPYTLWVQAVPTATGVSNLGSLGLPDVYLDLTLPVFVIVGAGVPSALGPLILLPGGATQAVVIPSSLAGLGQSLVLQGFVTSSAADNMIYAITHAHEVRVL